MAKTVKPKIVKCRYGRCFHETKELNAEDAARVGNTYYHKDCYQTKLDIEEIKKVFAERVNKNVNFPELTKVVNNLIFNRDNESGFILFALNYCIDHRWNLQYPAGLYHCVQNMDAQKAYQNMKQRKLQQEQQKNIFSINESSDSTFTYKPKKSSGFEAILGK